MAQFIHDRVIFAGDSAHQVSPFGARGANSGLEDAENLSWKLARVLAGQSPEALLGSYHIERSAAADENIRESTRSTDFMAPASKQEARLRQAVLALAGETEFAKRMINGGRLSTPSVYATPLSTPDDDAWTGGPPPGASMKDAPLRAGDGADIFLTDALKQRGRGFSLLSFANGAEIEPIEGTAAIRIGDGADFTDPSGTVAARYDALPGSAYLMRPDGYVAARFRRPTRAVIGAALARAGGLM
jgi:3-(3-hydroxy-phenyl)propionate hydroxylase